MIVGIGIDMIEVDRIRTKIEKEKGFREHIFSPAEITYCESQSDPYQHYAARFAGKESFLKAIGRGLSFSHDVFKIEILPESDGKPELHLHGEYKTLADEGGWKNIHVTLTHLATIAGSMVIIEK